MTKVKNVLLLSLLSLAVFACYFPVADFDFVNLDDGGIITENPWVQNGISLESLVWAFGYYNGYWHPASWIYLTGFIQLFGADSGALHLANALFHLINAVLLFLIFERMTKAFWRSAMVAALFALHPLQVESVAWAVQFKSGLAVFWTLLSLLAYHAFTRTGKKTSYFLSLALFAIAIMCKAIVIMFPFLLLLLDYWPLKRLNEPGNIKARLLEKLPFLVLALGVMLITLYGAILNRSNLTPLSEYPLGARFQNVSLVYFKYLIKFIWPLNLAVLYPLTPQAQAVTRFIASALLHAGIAFGVIKAGNKHGYLAFGWFWFLIALLPVSGIYQAGPQEIADRFMYFPLIGMAVLFVWGIAEFMTDRKLNQRLLYILAAGTLGAMLLLSMRQVRVWKDSISLWNHSIRAGGPSAMAYLNLGEALLSEGRDKEAFEQLALALQQDRELAQAFAGLPAIAFQIRNSDEAIAKVDAQLAADGARRTKFYYYLAIAHCAMKETRACEARLEQTLQLQPGHEKAMRALQDLRSG